MSDCMVCFLTPCLRFWLSQAAVYGSRSAVLTPELFRSVLQMKLREHQQRRAFSADDPSAALV